MCDHKLYGVILILYKLACWIPALKNVLLGSLQKYHLTCPCYYDIFLKIEHYKMIPSKQKNICIIFLALYNILV